MSRVVIGVIAALAAVCVVEGVVIVRDRSSDAVAAWKLEQLRKGNEARKTFCAAYAKRTAALPLRFLDDSSAQDQEAAAAELLLLSDVDFLEVCVVDNRSSVARMRATAMQCRASFDVDCLRGFATTLMLKVPNPPAPHP